MDYPQIERRKDYIQMDGRLIEAEEKIDSLTTQITILCTELPYLKKAIEALTSQLKTHEENAMERIKMTGSCRDERIRNGESLRWLWVFFSALTLGLAWTILRK